MDNKDKIKVLEECMDMLLFTPESVDNECFGQLLSDLKIISNSYWRIIDILGFNREKILEDLHGSNWDYLKELKEEENKEDNSFTYSLICQCCEEK